MLVLLARTKDVAAQQFKKKLAFLKNDSIAGSMSHVLIRVGNTKMLTCFVRNKVWLGNAARRGTNRVTEKLKEYTAR